MQSSSSFVSVKHSKSAERGLAVLRIVVGLWFVKGVLTKLGVTMLWGVVPIPGASARWMNVMPMLLNKYASENPLGFYQAFILETVVPNRRLFAHLTALSEAVVGIGLTLGFLTVLASALGIWLVLNYGLATFWVGPSQQGFHLLLLACLIVFLMSRAGRRWGLDGWLRQNRPDSRLARLPLG